MSRANNVTLKIALMLSCAKDPQARSVTQDGWITGYYCKSDCAGRSNEVSMFLMHKYILVESAHEARCPHIN